VAVIADGCGHGPLKALLAPLAATFDALVGVVSGDVGRHLLATAWGRLPASLCRVKHDHLVTGGTLAGDVARLLDRAPKGVIASALSQALWAMLG
jgi:hypothetical protein